MKLSRRGFITCLSCLAGAALTRLGLVQARVTTPVEVQHTAPIINAWLLIGGSAVAAQAACRHAGRSLHSAADRTDLAMQSPDPMWPSC